MGFRKLADAAFALISIRNRSPVTSPSELLISVTVAWSQHPLLDGRNNIRDVFELMWNIIIWELKKEFKKCERQIIIACYLCQATYANKNSLHKTGLIWKNMFGRLYTVGNKFGSDYNKIGQMQRRIQKQNSKKSKFYISSKWKNKNKYTTGLLPTSTFSFQRVIRSVFTTRENSLAAFSFSNNPF